MNGWYKALEDLIWLTQLGLNILLPLVLCLGAAAGPVWILTAALPAAPALCAGRIQRNRAGVSWHTTLEPKSSVLYLCAAEGGCVGQFRPALPINKMPLQGSRNDKRKADSLCLKAQAVSLLLSEEQRYIKAPPQRHSPKKFCRRSGGEISLFAGLLKCGECGKALTIRATNAKHPQQIYSCKTYNAYGKNHCTQHRIEYDTLYQLVLEQIRACAQAALQDEEAVKNKLSNSCKAEQKAQQKSLERSLSKAEERLSVLDKMVSRLYEDLTMGRISEDNFNQMLAKTQKEQAGLKQQAARQRRELAGEMQEASDARQWTEAIKACANLTELDAITLNRLVKEIIVHERIDEEGTRHISVEIHFNLKPLPEATEAIAV